MTGLLLDTHVLIWLVEDDKRLGKKARKLVSQAHKEGTLFISAISFWEVGTLIAKQKIILPRPLDYWRADILQTGIVEINISGDIGVLSTQLNWEHPDPADRMICASAILRGLDLLTADKVILSWKNAMQRLNAKT